MSLFQSAKPKSAGKVMIPSGKKLQELVLVTLKQLSDIVGNTLGPLGRQILIERPEMELKPILTKDGVTVVKSLGFHDPVKQLILEAARDVSIQTANDAGDGTTTASILAYSIAKKTIEMSNQFKRVSPQAIVREMQKLIPDIIKILDVYKIEVKDEELFFEVCKLSANGDTELAQAVVKAFNLVGDEGNLTIVDKISMNSGYKVSKLSGYTVESGYEESCKHFGSGFVNDHIRSLVRLEKPVIILFNGKINHINQLVIPLEKLAKYFDDTNHPNKSVVIVAHEFDAEVVAHLHVNWGHPDSHIKIFPLKTQMNFIANSEVEFLNDLQAYTQSPVFNPITVPLVDLDPADLVTKCKCLKVECGRFRSSIICEEDPMAVELRVGELKEQLKDPESEYEATELQRRIGKLTSGIAQLEILAPSSGEAREKKDRADDAWLAGRGSIKHGALPGGGFALVKLSSKLIRLAGPENNMCRKLALNIVAEALLEPVEKLYENYGWSTEDIDSHLLAMLNSDKPFDIFKQEWVESKFLLDSVPAVVEAIRNSISIASLLGTLGGIVSFDRDTSTDKEEEQFKRSFERTIGER